MKIRGTIIINSSPSMLEEEGTMSAQKSKFPKLFITDLDGTALGGFRPYSRFPDVFSEFLDKLDKHGCKWATNTAWEAKPQIDLILGSTVKRMPAYVSGAVSLELAVLKGDQLENVQPYTDIMREKLEMVHDSCLNSFIKDICSKFDSIFLQYNESWFAFTPYEEQVEALFAYIEEKYPDRSQLMIQLIPEEKRIIALPAFLTKDVVVREISKLMGLTAEDIVVAGDSEMDLAMMKPDVAKYCICPNNASEQVKKWVRENGGVVGSKDYGPGTIEAFEKLAEINGWDWD